MKRVESFFSCGCQNKLHFQWFSHPTEPDPGNLCVVMCKSGRIIGGRTACGAYTSNCQTQTHSQATPTLPQQHPTPHHPKHTQIIHSTPTPNSTQHTHRAHICANTLIHTPEQQNTCIPNHTFTHQHPDHPTPHTPIAKVPFLPRSRFSDFLTHTNGFRSTFTAETFFSLCHFFLSSWSKAAAYPEGTCVEQIRADGRRGGNCSEQNQEKMGRAAIHFRPQRRQGMRNKIIAGRVGQEK